MWQNSVIQTTTNKSGVKHKNPIFCMKTISSHKKVLRRQLWSTISFVMIPPLMSKMFNFLRLNWNPFILACFMFYYFWEKEQKLVPYYNILQDCSNLNCADPKPPWQRNSILYIDYLGTRDVISKSSAVWFLEFRISPRLICVLSFTILPLKCVGLWIFRETCKL